MRYNLSGYLVQLNSIIDSMGRKTNLITHLTIRPQLSSVILNLYTTTLHTFLFINICLKNRIKNNEYDNRCSHKFKLSCISDLGV